MNFPIIAILKTDHIMQAKLDRILACEFYVDIISASIHLQTLNIPILEQQIWKFTYTIHM